MIKYRPVNIIFLAILLCLVGLDTKVTISGWYYAALIFAYLTIQAYGATMVSSQFFMPVRTTGKVSEPFISLTFDDGPVPAKTENVLDILKTHGVSAAFFCIGKRVKENPEIVRRMQAEGHMIGNHSFWHSSLFDLQSSGKISAELAATDAAICDCTGLSPRFFRPPYGVTNPMVATAVVKKGYVSIGWSIRSYDTVTTDSAKLLNHITGSLKGGDIILLHDYSESMIRMLPDLLTTIHNLGLKIVRVDQLLDEKPYV